MLLRSSDVHEVAPARPEEVRVPLVGEMVTSHSHTELTNPRPTASDPALSPLPSMHLPFPLSSKAENPKP